MRPRASHGRPPVRTGAPYRDVELRYTQWDVDLLQDDVSLSVSLQQSRDPDEVVLGDAGRVVSVVQPENLPVRCSR